MHDDVGDLLAIRETLDDRLGAHGEITTIPEPTVTHIGNESRRSIRQPQGLILGLGGQPASHSGVIAGPWTPGLPHGLPIQAQLDEDQTMPLSDHQPAVSNFRVIGRRPGISRLARGGLDPPDRDPSALRMACT